MAPDLEILKRKRNAPGSWWAISTASPLRPPIAPTRIKRSKPSNEDSVNTQQERKLDAAPSKTRSSQTSQIDQSSRSREVVSNQDQESEAYPQQGPNKRDEDSKSSKRKRSRPSDYWIVQPGEFKSSAESPAKKQHIAADRNSTQRKRESVSEDPSQQNLKGSNISQSTDPPKRGRPKKSQPSQLEQTKRNRSRASLGFPEPDIVTAISSFGKAKSQRRVATIVPLNKSSQVTSGKFLRDGITVEATTGRGKRSGKASTTVAEIQKDKQKTKTHSQSKKRRRSKQEHTLEHDFMDDEGPPSTYQHLAPITHRVPRHAIEKWEPLPFSCIESISQMLNSAERPVVMHLYDERKRNHATTAIGMVTRRLVKKLSKKLPFPVKSTATRDDDFDFENIVNIKATLEGQLTPALHANELLKAELWKEKALLDAEEADLADLESNAKSESQKRKQAERKAHVLLQPQAAEDQTLDDVGLNGELQHRNVPLTISNDEGLDALLKEVYGHVDSLQGNVSQVGGVSEGIARSKAAVQITFSSHLNHDEFEAVVLG